MSKIAYAVIRVAVCIDDKLVQSDMYLCHFGQV